MRILPENIKKRELALAYVQIFLGCNNIPDLARAINTYFLSNGLKIQKTIVLISDKLTDLVD